MAKPFEAAPDVGRGCRACDPRGALLLVGGVWLHKEARSFSRVWEAVTDDMKDARA